MRELKENASQSQSTEVEELRQKLKKAESEISQINSKLGTTETKLAQTEEKLSKVTKIKSKLTFNQIRFSTTMVYTKLEARVHFHCGLYLILTDLKITQID